MNEEIRDILTDAEAIEDVYENTRADRRDTMFFALFFACCYLFVAFGSGMQLGFSVAYGVFFAVASLYLCKRRFDAFTAVCGVIALAAAPAFTLYSNPAVMPFAALGMLVLTLIYIAGLGGSLKRRGFRMLYDIGRVGLILPFANFTLPFRGLKSNGRRHGSLMILLGCVIAIPAVLVIMPLLMSADSAFEQMMDGFFSGTVDTVAHLIGAAVLTPFVVAVLFSMRYGLDDMAKEGERRTWGIEPGLISGFLGIISLCYVVYLVSQLGYFFDGFIGELSDGFTPAEYARRGFFELSAISVINLGILFLACTLVKKTDGIPGFVRGCGIFICIFELVLAATVISKLVLYIEYYGLTRLRVLTTVFAVMMGIVFLMSALRLLRPSFPYMKAALIGCAALGLLTLYADIDALIAGYNVNAYLDGKLDSVDLANLCDLSDSAVPYIWELYEECVDEDVRMQTATLLSWKLHECGGVDDGGKLTEPRPFKLRSFNLGEKRANGILREHFSEYYSIDGAAKWNEHRWSGGTEVFDSQIIL